MELLEACDVDCHCRWSFRTHRYNWKTTAAAVIRQWLFINNLKTNQIWDQSLLYQDMEWNKADLNNWWKGQNFQRSDHQNSKKENWIKPSSENAQIKDQKHQKMVTFFTSEKPILKSEKLLCSSSEMNCLWMLRERGNVTQQPVFVLIQSMET